MADCSGEDLPEVYSQGAWHVSALDSVILNSVSGAFDADSIQQLLALQKQHLPDTNTKWAYVCDGRHWSGASPDTVTVVRDIVSWDSRHGCELRIFILPESAYQQGIIDKFEYEINQSGGELEVVHKPEMAADLAYRKGFVKSPSKLLQLLHKLHQPKL